MEEILVAAFGAIRSDDGYAVLALGESPSGEGRHVLVSRMLQPDGTAVPDEPYTVSTEHGLTTEGGIVGWEVQGRVLSLALSAEAAETLGFSQELRMVLSDAANEDRVRRAMAWLIDPRAPIPEDVFQLAPTNRGRHS